MSKRQIHDTAISLLRGKASYIKPMIDRGSSIRNIELNLTELQIQADFALTLGIITEDEHEELKEKWYHFRELLKVISDN